VVVFLTEFVTHAGCGAPAMLTSLERKGMSAIQSRNVISDVRPRATPRGDNPVDTRLGPLEDAADKCGGFKTFFEHSIECRYSVNRVNGRIVLTVT
jgi:hypothetical protein